MSTAIALTAAIVARVERDLSLRVVRDRRGVVRATYERTGEVEYAASLQEGKISTTVGRRHLD